MTQLDHESGDAAVQSNGKDGRRRWGPMEWTGFVSAIAGSIGVIIALLAWLLPVPDNPPPDSTAASSGAPTTAGTASGAGTPSPSSSPSVAQTGPALRYLNTIVAESGNADLATFPRALNGAAGYDHPIVIECPTNETTDKVSQVTYRLGRRYLDFTATVRPYFERAEDRDGQTRVYAHVGTRQVDDTMTTVVKGSQFTATGNRSAPLTASVEGGDVLTLVVECEFSGGFVVLVDAGLTRAE